MQTSCIPQLRTNFAFLIAHCSLRLFCQILSQLYIHYVLKTRIYHLSAKMASPICAFHF